MITTSLQSKHTKQLLNQHQNQHQNHQCTRLHHHRQNRTMLLTLHQNQSTMSPRNQHHSRSQSHLHTKHHPNHPSKRLPRRNLSTSHHPDLNPNLNHQSTTHHQHLNLENHPLQNKHIKRMLQSMCLHLNTSTSHQ